MGSVLSTVLITAPVAFLVGWLLSKAVFNHLSVTRPNPRVAPRLEMPASKDSQLTEKPATEDHTEINSVQSETRLLKEAVIERDHLIDNLKQKLAAKPEPLEDTAANAAAQENKLRETVSALRQGLTTKEQQLELLKHDLQAAEQKSVTNLRLLKSGRNRIKAIAQQFRQQKLIISELREELKQRALRQRDLEVSRQQNKSARLKQAPKPTTNNSHELRALQGVGPAMQMRLNEQGIYRLKQLAEMDSATLTTLGEALSINKSRMAKIDWSAQARQLLNQSAPISSASAEAEAEAALAS